MPQVQGFISVILKGRALACMLDVCYITHATLIVWTPLATCGHRICEIVLDN